MTLIEQDVPTTPPGAVPRRLGQPRAKIAHRMVRLAPACGHRVQPVSSMGAAPDVLTPVVGRPQTR